MNIRSGAQTPRRSPTRDAPGVGHRRHKPDYSLVIISAVLLVLGLVVVYAISPGLSAQRNVSENYYISKQLIAILLGTAAFIITANISVKQWPKLERPLLILAALATLAALILPVTPEYPAHRWIRFGGLSLQSVELIKGAVLIWLAAFLARRVQTQKIHDDKEVLKPLAIVMGILAVVVAGLQSDLGSAAVLIAMMLVMIYVAGVPLKRLSMIAVAMMVLGTLFIVVSPYRRARISTFVNPTSDCQKVGYQACQALITVGSGGVFGKGLASSGQAYGYLPEAANDSIFAIFAEKFGFFGSSLLVIAFAWFFTRIKHITERAPDMFTRLVAVGVLAWLSTQAFINIGAMLGLFPLKGITLPFISYGGTSIIFVLAAVGLVFNISRYTTPQPNAELDAPAPGVNSSARRANGSRSALRPSYGAYTARKVSR